MKQEDWGSTAEPTVQVAEILIDPDLEQSWSSCITNDAGLTSKERTAALTFIKNNRDNFVRTIGDIPDPCERLGVTAVYYAFLTAQWILLNTQAGYQSQSGDADRSVLCKAGLVSTTLGAVERALTLQNAELVRRFFADLVRSGNNDPELGNDKLSGNQSLNVLHAEHLALRAELQRLFTESGTDTVEATIQHWRDVRGELGKAAATSAQAQAYLAAFALEFGENVSPKDVIKKVRQLNDEVGFLGSDLEAARLTWQTMEREFGVSSPEQIMQMVRDLRDKISDLTQENASNGSDIELLKREAGNNSVPEIIQQFTSLREQNAAMESELSALRAERNTLTQELGNVDVNTIIRLIEEQKEQAAALEKERLSYRESQESVLRELGIDSPDQIVSRLRALNARGNAFGELSALLGNMDQVLTTFSA